MQNCLQVKILRHIIRFLCRYLSLTLQHQKIYHAVNPAGEGEWGKSIHNTYYANEHILHGYTYRKELRKGNTDKDMEPQSDCASIDAVLTGKRIHEVMIQNGYSVKELQILLNLSCPQPIYRWMKGKCLPTIDHLYMMSKLFHIHMEELLVACNE